MNTYSHTLLAAALNKLEKKRVAAGQVDKRVPPLHTAAFLIGSFLPDVPLILLTIVLIGYDALEGRPLYPASMDYTSNIQYLFDHLFFHSPFVKTLHNLFHAPLLVALYIALGYWGWRRGKKWGAAVFWLGMSAALHTAADIPLHYNDGPLLLFPFNLDVRFHSPLSYWDPQRYGRQWSIFELLLDLVLIGYLIKGWRSQRRAKTASS